MDTSRFVLSNPRHVLSGFLIVAMSVVDPFVADIILPAESDRDDMVNFQNVFFSEVELASWALPFLKSEQFRFLASHQGMLFKPLRPVDQVPIVWTCLPSDLHVVFVERVRVFSDRERFHGPSFVFYACPKSETPVHFDGVSFPEPLFAFPRMSRLLPAGQLFEGDILTGVKYL